jgi:hypothetical protein
LVARDEKELTLMSEVLQWLSTHPAVANLVIITLTFSVIAMAFIYLVEFWQGRSVSFWPPKIGTPTHRHR